MTDLNLIHELYTSVKAGLHTKHFFLQVKSSQWSFVGPVVTYLFVQQHLKNYWSTSLFNWSRTLVKAIIWATSLGHINVPIILNYIKICRQYCTCTPMSNICQLTPTMGWGSWHLVGEKCPHGALSVLVYRHFQTHNWSLLYNF